MNYLNRLTGSSMWKTLVCMFAILVVGLILCGLWSWGIIYIDQVVKDPGHSGLIAGLSIGFVIPVAATALLVFGSFVLGEEL